MRKEHWLLSNFKAWIKIKDMKLCCLSIQHHVYHFGVKATREKMNNKCWYCNTKLEE